MPTLGSRTGRLAERERNVEAAVATRLTHRELAAGVSIGDENVGRQLRALVAGPG